MFFERELQNRGSVNSFVTRHGRLEAASLPVADRRVSVQDLAHSTRERI
jgi:hypothetical protein